MMWLYYYVVGGVIISLVANIPAYIDIAVMHKRVVQDADGLKAFVAI
jgi:hypothetical protein